MLVPTEFMFTLWERIFAMFVKFVPPKVPRRNRCY